MTKVNIRKGQRNDINALRALILELAEYEKAIEKVTITEEQLLIDGFGDQPIFQFIVAEKERKVVGIALYCLCYSTWKGKMLFLDDLIVLKQYRNLGIGKLLIDEIFKTAKHENCKMVKWQVLDWNESAIQFYDKLGATFDHEWVDCKFYENDIKILAE